MSHCPVTEYLSFLCRSQHLACCMLITSDAEASGRPAKPAVRARNSASAASLLEVLMEGPAKVGKEILMHAYHPRAHRPRRLFTQKNSRRFIAFFFDDACAIESWSSSFVEEEVFFQLLWLEGGAYLWIGSGDHRLDRRGCARNGEEQRRPPKTEFGRTGLTAVGKKYRGSARLSTTAPFHARLSTTAPFHAALPGHKRSPRHERPARERPTSESVPPRPPR